VPADPPPLLRPLEPRDQMACLELDRDALAGLWSAEQWLIELSDPARPGLGLWAGSSLLALACGWLVVDELHITALAVRSSHRRQGLGARVLAGLLGQARQAGARHATLEVASGNAAARALYTAAGFAEAGVRRHYYQNGDDAVINWLRLKD
jgi:ribosomal-protein-alanine N-acetyltransferase